MITVRVPATSANLGPGFDVLGLALALYNEIRVEPAPAWSVTVVGEGRGELAEDETNLVVVAMHRLAASLGETLPAQRVECVNAIPPGRGLGSSAAAIVGGLTAANELLGRPCDRDGLMAHAFDVEGHGDNVAAALCGGFTIFYAGEDGTPRVLSLDPATDLAAVVVVPDAPLPTEAARKVLPHTLSYEDVKYQMARVALLAIAVSQGRTELLADATSDRMHQPARRPLEVGYGAAERALTDAGALAVSLSGAGPSVFGWVTAGAAVEVRDRVARTLSEGAPGAPRVVALELDRQGVTVH